MNEDTVTAYRVRRSRCQVCGHASTLDNWVVFIGDNRASVISPLGIHMADNLVDARDWVWAHGGHPVYRQEPEGWLRSPGS